METSPKEHYLQIKGKNCFVWARIHGCSYWPAIVIKDNVHKPLKSPDNMQWVYFLGTHNYSWVKNDNIKPYNEFKSKYRKKRTESAENEMDDIIENLNKDADYKMPLVPYEPRKSAVKRTKSPKRSHTPVTRKKTRVTTPRQNITADFYHTSTTKQFLGFLAGSIYSEGIVKNLINNKHKLNIWSKNQNLCKKLQEYAVKQRTLLIVCTSPREVVKNSNMTFSCVADPEEIKEVLQQLGVNDKSDSLLNGASFIEMSSYNPDTVFEDFHHTIRSKNIQYLEAMLQCSKQEAKDGRITILAAGSLSLFNTCQSCFNAMSRSARYLGEIGSARKMHLLFQMLKGAFLATLVEGFIMADRSLLEIHPFNQTFQATHMSSDYLKGKSNAIEYNKLTQPRHTQEPIEQLQSEIAQGLELAAEHLQPMPLTSYTNQIFKNARRLGRDGRDSASIYQTGY